MRRPNRLLCTRSANRQHDSLLGLLGVSSVLAYSLLRLHHRLMGICIARDRGSCYYRLPGIDG